jgi:hypothetical protein
VEILTVLRLLVRRRRLVALGLLVAVAAGAVATGKLGIGPIDTQARRTWVATSEVQIDTPRPLSVDAHASAATIQTQTILLADYLTSDASRDAIARKAAVDGAELTVSTPSIDSPLRQSPLVVRASLEAAISRTPYTVISIPAQLTPIMAVTAMGPDRETTVALSDAAVSALDAAAGASDDAGRGLETEALGPIRVDAFTSSRSGLVLGVALTVFLFASWCGAIVIGTGLVRAWRRSSPGYQRTPVGLR